MGATATLEIETEAEKDAQAIYERSLQLQKVGSIYLALMFIFTQPFIYLLLIYLYERECVFLLPEYCFVFLDLITFHLVPVSKEVIFPSSPQKVLN